MIILKEKKQPESFFSGNSLDKPDKERIPPEAKGVQKTVPRLKSKKVKKAEKIFKKAIFK